MVVDTSFNNVLHLEYLTERYAECIWQCTSTDRCVKPMIRINILAYLIINTLPTIPITQTNLLMMFEEKQAFIPGIIRKFKLLMLEGYVITDNT